MTLRATRRAVVAGAVRRTLLGVLGLAGYDEVDSVTDRVRYARDL
jgi:hypothetical protein